MSIKYNKIKIKKKILKSIEILEETNNKLVIFCHYNFKMYCTSSRKLVSEFVKIVIFVVKLQFMKRAIGFGFVKLVYICLCNCKKLCKQ